MKKNKSYIYFLSLGSNIFNRFYYLIEAKKNLLNYGNILGRSRYMLTSPIGNNASFHFLNQILLFETDFDAFSFLDIIKNIEILLGRKNRGHWGDREIDIDILLVYKNSKLLEYHGTSEKGFFLQVPHKEIFSRLFVLEGLMDILGVYTSFHGQLLIDNIYCEKIKRKLDFLKNSPKTIQFVKFL